LKPISLDNVPFQIDLTTLRSMVHIRSSQGDHLQELEQLLCAALAIGKHKGMYKVGYIDSESDDSIVVYGIVFTSRVLRVNLEQTYKVFPFIATCGTELEEWARSKDDLLLRFWAETINEMVLHSVLQIVLQCPSQHKPYNRQDYTQVEE